MTAIAFLGLGHMGAPMARRLVAAGHDVAVWNRTKERAAALAGDGARVADFPGDAAAGAEIVITMLTGPAAVTEVVFGPAGVAESIRPGACLIEMSTIGPDAVRSLADRLPAGIALVDAPVGGSVDRAEAGTLLVLAGGTPADLDRVEPILGELGTVRRCGGSGSGAATKLVANTALVTGTAALGEILGLASSLGVPEELALDVLGAGPLGGVVQRVLGSGGQFTVALAAKDLALATGHASAPMPMATAALEAARAAALDSPEVELRVLALSSAG